MYMLTKHNNGLHTLVCGNGVDGILIFCKYMRVIGSVGG